MTIEFTIVKNRETLERQWAFLFRRGRSGRVHQLRAFFWGLMAATLLYTGFYLLTPADAFVGVKVVLMVMLPLIWCMMAAAAAWMEVDKRKGLRHFRIFMDMISDAELHYTVAMNSQTVTITNTGGAHVLPWTDYTAYGLHGETIYVFNVVENLYTLFWDRDEMGEGAYLALADWVKEKGLRKAF